MAAAHAIGVDLGGTKIEAVVLEGASLRGAERPRELARERVATNRERGYEHVVAESCALVRTVAQKAGIDPTAATIGVGMPGGTTTLGADGRRSETLLVKNSNTTCLNGRPFRSDLVAALGRPVTFANDANCFALAEATWGAARGARVTFGIIMGTGVGGGLVFTDGAGVPRAWDGAQGIAGEWGHVGLEPASGPACYCGRRGCIEAYLSGPAIEAAYAGRAGAPRSLAEIVAQSHAGDAVATAVVAERVALFGRALAIVINVVDPDVIVLGGGVSHVAAFESDGPAAALPWVFNDQVTTRIVRNALGDSAGVLGAALLPLDARSPR